MADAALTFKVLQPFGAKHQYRLGIEDQLGLFREHPPLPQLLRLQQLQVVLLAVALDWLLRVGWAEQLTLSVAAIAPVRLRCSHLKAIFLTLWPLQLVKTGQDQFKQTHTFGSMGEFAISYA